MQPGQMGGSLDMKERRPTPCSPVRGSLPLGEGLLHVPSGDSQVPTLGS